MKLTEELGTPVTIARIRETLETLQAAGAPASAEVTIGRKRNGSALLVSSEWKRAPLQPDLLTQEAPDAVTGLDSR